MLDRRLHPPRRAGAQRDEALVQRRGEIARLLVGIGADHGHGGHDAGLGQLFRGLEPLAIDLERGVELGRREVRGEGIGQAQHRRELRAEQAGAQHPQLDVRAGSRRRRDRQRGIAAQPGLQFHHVLGKLVRRLHQVLAQGLGDPPVRPRRAAEAQVDAAGEQGVEGAELLGDDEGIVIGQHDPARADADRPGGLPDMGEDDRGRAAGDAFHPVVLGHPEALVAGLFGGLRGKGGLRQRLAHAAAFAHRDQVEDGQRDHGAGVAAAGAGTALSWAR